MARKSAASAKLVKPKPELRPLEEVFDEIVSVFKMTVEANVKTAMRVDNLVAVRQLYRDWYGKEPNDIDVIKKLQKLTADTYSDILAATENFNIEDFKADEMKDYFEDIVPNCEDIDSDADLLNAHVKWLCVRDYGSKLVQAHQLFHQEMEKRDAE